MEEISITNLSCPHCSAIINEKDVFCGTCGKEIVQQEKEVSGNVFLLLQPTILYYFITLALLAIYKFTEVFPSGLEGLLVVSALDVAIVLIFWLNNFSEIRPLFRIRGLSLKIMALTIIGAILGSIAVSYIAHIINLSINDDVFYSTSFFLDNPYPLLVATLLIAVQPAIFEEVAFRGFIFNNVKEISGGMSPVYISAFIFGIMHLAIISLIWLVPIGLAFGYLRNRYNTLWYGVVGHFVYNFFITLNEFWGWF